MYLIWQQHKRRSFSCTTGYLHTLSSLFHNIYWISRKKKILGNEQKWKLNSSLFVLTIRLLFFLTQNRQCTDNVKLRRTVRTATVAVENQWKCYTFWECVCNLRSPSMQCACAILSHVACPALQHFSTLSHKRHDFRGGELLNIICVFWFSQQLLSATVLLLRGTERNIIKNVYWSSCTGTAMLLRF